METSSDDLRAELAKIIEWLAVDKPAHMRYQPTKKATFCKVYAHDYCFLAGVYLPRVWWRAGFGNLYRAISGASGPRIRREHEQETAPEPCIGL